MKLLLGYILALACFTWAATTVAQTTYYVANGGGNVSPYTSWGDAATDIATAIGEADDGDTVLVSNGTYYLSSEIDVLKGITVRSFNNGALDRDGTVIDGQDSVRGFDINHDDAVVTGFTVTNCKTVEYGGGVRIYSGVMSNCVLIGNTCNNSGTRDGGGGAYLRYGGKIVDSLITGNSCPSNYISGIWLHDGGIAERCVISNNYMTGVAEVALWVQNSTASWCRITSHDDLGVRLSHGGMISNCTVTANQPGVEVEFGTGGDTITGCWITNNTHNSSGGGIRIRDNNVTILNTLIAGNEATLGAGIWVDVGVATISNCVIEGNNSTPNWGGGADCGGLADFTDCIIRDNTSAASGGGLYEPRAVVRCHFENNSALSGGGGGMVINDSSVISNCTLEANEASQNGGGIQAINGGVIRNCLLVRNRATDEGGGIYAGNMALGGGIIDSCTVVSNNADSTQGGGGISMIYTNAYRNCIIAFNTASDGPDIDVDYGSVPMDGQFTNCCVPTYTLPAGDGNITNFPKLVDLSGGDYRLRSGSPCINAGLNAPWMQNALDLDGYPRITTATVDMGAYEYRPSGTVLILR